LLFPDFGLYYKLTEAGICSLLRLINVLRLCLNSFVKPAFEAGFFGGDLAVYCLCFAPPNKCAKVRTDKIFLAENILIFNEETL